MRIVLLMSVILVTSPVIADGFIPPAGYNPWLQSYSIAWNNAGNWGSAFVPNGIGENICLGDGPSVLPQYWICDLTTQPQTVGNIIFLGEPTIIQSTGGLALTLDNGSSSSAVKVTGNTNTIDVLLIINSNVIVSGAGILNVGDISGKGGITKSGSGTLVLTHAISYNGNTVIQQGEVDINNHLNTTLHNISNNGILQVIRFPIQNCAFNV
jgi:autotransporter-associated beta strand protein